LKKICETVYVIYGNVFMAWALSRINKVQNRNCWKIFDESLPYPISIKSVELFMECMGISVHGLT
jgi:hypothetical protein